MYAWTFCLKNTYEVQSIPMEKKNTNSSYLLIGSFISMHSYLEPLCCVKYMLAVAFTNRVPVWPPPHQPLSLQQQTSPKATQGSDQTFKLNTWGGSISVFLFPPLPSPSFQSHPKALFTFYESFSEGETTSSVLPTCSSAIYIYLCTHAQTYILKYIYCIQKYMFM